MKICSAARINAAILTGVVLLVLVVTRTDALIEPDPNGLIRVSSSVSVDSVTVGQQFRVRHVFDYPDSLRMLDLTGIDPGSCRVLSLVWREETSENRVEKTADVTLITLDLEQARFPEVTLDFMSPSGDTLRVFAEEVVIPVRHIVTESAETKPLKEQWEAPRSVWKWVVIAALALLVAGAAIFWWRRRKAGIIEEPAKPKLPADYVALTELTRIEKLDLLIDGHFKQYYSLVSRAVRQYILDRFGVDALDRTTQELLWELDEIGKRIDRLEDLLKGADLVKFAKHLPGPEAASAALTTARRIVVTTTPKTVVADQPAGPGDHNGRTPHEQPTNGQRTG